MRRPLVLTGGPAVGKSTTGRALAEAAARAAFIDVDDLRHLIVSGHEPPWAGDEGRAQQALGVENACELAARLHAAGFDVVVADVVTPETAHTYRRKLPGCLLVHLVVSIEEALRRAATRKVWITEDEFRQLHRADIKQPPSADHSIDVTALTLSDQVASVAFLWRRSEAR